MFEQDFADQVVEEVPAMETVIRLTAFMEPGRERFAGLVDVDGYMEEYERARDALPDLSVDIEGQAIEPFPDDPAIQDHLTDFVEDVKFQEHYANEENVELGLVPIEQLVAWQPTVSTSGYQDLPTWEEDPMETLEYTLPLEDVSLGMVKEIQSADQDFVGIQLTSRSPNIRLSQMMTQRAEQRDALAVQFIISTDPNWIKVQSFKNRLILKNGYHRVFQMLQSGAELVPAVVANVDSYSEVSGQPEATFGKEQVLADRPPLVSDFTTDAVSEREESAENTTIRIMAERVDVPR